MAKTVKVLGRGRGGIGRGLGPGTGRGRGTGRGLQGACGGTRKLNGSGRGVGNNGTVRQPRKKKR